MAAFGMTNHSDLSGGGKQGRFEEEVTDLRRFYAKRPCFPPQSIKSNNVILSEAKDLIVLYINWLRSFAVSSAARDPIS